jgi:hypothetical protein
VSLRCDLAITVVSAVDLSNPRREAVHQLFDDTYDHADHSYLDRSLETLRFAALATAGRPNEPRTGTGDDERVVGFALGESRTVDLPRLPAQVVALAGLCCVESAFRRAGLFRSLEMRAITECTPQRDGERILAAGRMAHPASFRAMRDNVGVLPRPGVVPSTFQQEVACAVADIYAVDAFDPLTFVCQGRGRPIGDPRLTIEATDEEWQLFSDVDRDRGDSLLALCWIPDAPTGW